MLAQLLVSGAVIGFLYSLVVLGIVVIYRTTGVVNFAQGEIAMFTTFIGYIFLNKMGVSYSVSFILTLIIAFLIGIIIQRLIMKPVRNSSPLKQMVVSLGVLLILSGGAGILFGTSPRSFPQPFEEKSYAIGSIYITTHEIFIIVTTVCLISIFYYVLTHTKIGLAMRATAQDVQTAELMGVSVDKVFSWTWGTAAVLGSVAGMLVAPITHLDTSMMASVLIMAFAGAVLGGFVSLPGAVIGSLLIGVFQNIISGYISAELRTVFVFLVIVLILYLWPSGLMGKQIAKKV